jgi:alanine racemase
MPFSLSRAAQATIDLAALRHNLACVRAAAPAPGSAIIKADAYGHGVLPVARALAGADGFGVACLEEAMALRSGGIAQPIYAAGRLFHADELALASRHRLAVMLHDVRQLAALENHPTDAPLTVWLKLDTGMHRLGLAPDALRIPGTACKTVPGW